MLGQSQWFAYILLFLNYMYYLELEMQQQVDFISKLFSEQSFVQYRSKVPHQVGFLHWANIWQLLPVKYKICIFYPISGGKLVAKVHRLLHSCFLRYPCAMLSESRPIPPSHRMGFLWDH